MTRPEALTILREARELYANIAHLTSKVDLNPLITKRPITNANLLQLYALERDYHPLAHGKYYLWRHAAFPLYYAIMMACDKFRRSCPDGDLLTRINTLHKDAPQIERMSILIRTCISILHGDH